MKHIFYQGETLPLREEFDVAVDTARFYLKDSTGAVTTVDATLSDDGLVATAYYDLPATCRTDRWTYECITGGEHKRFVRVGSFEVETQPFPTAEAPTDPVYYGVGAAGKSDVTGLTSANHSSLDFTFTVSPSNEKVYLAYPSALGTATIKVDAWPFDFIEPAIIAISDVDYYLYESTNTLTGTAVPFAVSQ